MFLISECIIELYAPLIHQDLSRLVKDSRCDVLKKGEKL